MSSLPLEEVCHVDARRPGAHDADLGRLALGAAHRVERGTW